MSQYLLSFARENLVGKSNAYLALLWCMYKGRQDKGRYSDHIKVYLSSANKELLTTNYPRCAQRFKKILDARPELGWVAPSGLRPLSILQVRNFRGFGTFGPEDKGTLLRFSKIKNIFYAPNGGGKSSLCEALEYAATGHIKEANRRKTKVKQYVARGAGKVELKLMCTDRKPVTANLTWSSCFIDRNRLQEFSLLGSKDSGSAESDVIATLFGLEEFQEVISRFVKPENFNLAAHRRPSQSEALRTLDTNRAELHEQRRRHRYNISSLNDEVCACLGLSINQQFAVRARHARLTRLAELKLLKADRLKGAELPVAPPMKQIRSAMRIASRLLARKSAIEAAFLKNVKAVNYRAVYEALHAIDNVGASEQCPACSTPLAYVVENPFEKARRELATLSVLDQLKSAQQYVDESVIQLALAIGRTVAAIDGNERLGTPCALTLECLRATMTDFHCATDRAEAAAQVLTNFIELLANNEAEVEAYLQVCVKKQREIGQVEIQIKRLQREAEKLKQVAEGLRALFDEKKLALGALKEIGRQLTEVMRQRSSLQNSDVDNVRLNTLVEQLQLEYGNLYRDLLEYKFTLEKARISGIEGKAAEYYKAINHHDDDHERIESLIFEKTNETYRIKILNADGGALDAFSVLSEGHLRALGLSLLLAMAEKNKFPLIVFDDVVNAIDTEHRSNIIDLFFTDPYLRRTQMIITTHDRLFWERFCIIADRNPQSDQHSSCILSYTNYGIIMVDHAGGFQEKIHRALSVYDIRQALIYCRIWFESMVLEYCLDNAVSVTAQFKKSALKKSIYLQLSLEKTFALVEPHIAYDRAHYDFIKRDLVNWGGQNQEHHAFDEGSLNFVHSKTSSEVVNIYDAIRFFECQLFTQKKQFSCNNLLEDLRQKIAACLIKIAQMTKAPVEAQQAQQRRLAMLQMREKEVIEELVYVGDCLLAQATRGGIS